MDFPPALPETALPFLSSAKVEMTSEAIVHFLNCFLSEASKDLREEVRERGGGGCSWTCMMYLCSFQSTLANGHVRKKKGKKSSSRGQKGRYGGFPRYCNLKSDHFQLFPLIFQVLHMCSIACKILGNRCMGGV